MGSRAAHIDRDGENPDSYSMIPVLGIQFSTRIAALAIDVLLIATLVVALRAALQAWARAKQSGDARAKRRAAALLWLIPPPLAGAIVAALVLAKPMADKVERDTRVAILWAIAGLMTLVLLALFASVLATARAQLRSGRPIPRGGLAGGEWTLAGMWTALWMSLVVFSGPDGFTDLPPALGAWMIGLTLASGFVTVPREILRRKQERRARPTPPSPPPL